MTDKKEEKIMIRQFQPAAGTRAFWTGTLTARTSTEAKLFTEIFGIIRTVSGQSEISSSIDFG